VLFEHDYKYELETKYNLHGSATKENTLVYEGDEAYVLARMISEINLCTTVDGKNFAQQYMLKKGLEKFGDKGQDACTKELEQLHTRSCFQPIDVSMMTPSE